MLISVAAASPLPGMLGPGTISDGMRVGCLSGI